MRARRGGKPKLVIKNGAVNSVNCTTGGTIFVVNGSPSALDYEGMRAIASDASKAQSGPCSPPSTMGSGQPTSSAIPQLMATFIIDGAINDLQNTTGGIIALINKRSQGADNDDARTAQALTALKVSDTPVDVFSAPPQLDGELITLTLLPRSRWQTSLNLEVIQQRNKPKEAPKVPEKAPFFLPTLPGVETRFAPEAKEPAKDTKATRRLETAKVGTESVFCQKLQAEQPDSHHSSVILTTIDPVITDEAFFNYAKMLSPAALDLELRSPVTLDVLSLFIHALTQRLQSHRDFEAVQAMQNVFLRMHGKVLIANAELTDAMEMETLAQTQQKESQRLLELISSSLALSVL